MYSQCEQDKRSHFMPIILSLIDALNDSDDLDIKSNVNSFLKNTEQYSSKRSVLYSPYFEHYVCEHDNLSSN